MGYKLDHHKFLNRQFKDFNFYPMHNKICGRFGHFLSIHILVFQSLRRNVGVKFNFLNFLVLCLHTTNHFQIVMHRILCSINLKILNQISNGFKNQRP
jgi:hypothetical protein